MGPLIKLALLACFIPLIFDLTSSNYFKYKELEASDIYRSRSVDILDLNSKSRRYLNKLPKLSTNTYDEYPLNYTHNKTNFERENATLLMLVRNMELDGALKSMRSLEDRFNRNYNYDWTFLNDVPFTEEFIEATSAMASGKAQYGLIPSNDWDRPNWINETKFESKIKEMEDNGVLYGGSKSYRNMCRFNSGYFFRQELLSNYDYYFRVEPNVDYFCDFPYDPFKIMKEKHKKYGFVITIYEYEETIPTLWDAVEEYIKVDNGQDIDMETNAVKFITDKSLVGRYYPIVHSNSSYNLCHFWSNFEIGDLNFFRSEEYIKFFEFLDATGGFYYERWGDAPVHSILVSLLLDRDEIIHFDQLGYTHLPFDTCPTAYHLQLDQRCLCDPGREENIDITPNSCLMRWWKNGAGKSFMREG
ncbi:hypothetical protein KAFR_0F01960 [Kazachstania africana CBS 2517]|uniref:Glycosyltransferase family 15 protein n=1 Tax=Kazachstania africana (strain ATCC 22294 / BCRC 22015 / CBS 2517 / CECT 1963 / NBRC 1671 / NRRL Y-8276) TaxID=1071382 RepID=H2AWP3_KAZAF|nr:hypothetical protein KAFR_0F01960 [Kazachstania africana CBS 2517]CCF58793.1 hypothetical protein KAFR_0F01960 [Kazachstania africana CBS 2517]